MDPEDDDDVDVEHKIARALNSIDPTGELAHSSTSNKFAKINTDVDEFVAGMFHRGCTAQEIMVFGLRMFMLGNLIHTQNVIKALKFKPPKNPEEDDHWSYQ